MSLRAEIADFIGSYNARDKLSSENDTRAAGSDLARARSALTRQQTSDLQDPEFRGAKLDRLRSTTRYANAMSGLMDQRRTSALGVGGGLLPIEGYSAPNDTVQSSGGDLYAPGGPLAEGAPNDQGVYPGFEDGGLVDDGDMDDSGGDAGGVEDVAHRAVRDGLLYGQQQFGLGGQRGALPDPRRQQGVRAYMQGAGGLDDPKVMQMLYQKVDPQGKLNDDQRRMAVLGAVYNHAMSKGDRKGAAGAAFQIVQTYRNDANRAAAAARHFYEGGDMQQAAKAMADWYKAIPNGKPVDLRAEGNNIVYTDVGPDGKPTKRRVLRPNEIGAAIMKMTPDKFDEFIARAAGERSVKTSPKRALTMRDMESGHTAVDKEVDGQLTGYTEGTANRNKLGKAIRDNYLSGDEPTESSRRAMMSSPGTELEISGRERVGDTITGGAENKGTTTGSDEVKHIAAAVYAQNPDRLSPTGVVNFVTKLAGTNTASDAFNVKKMDDGGVVVSDRAGRSITLSPDVFRQLAALRGKNNQGVLERLDKDANRLVGTAKVDAGGSRLEPEAPFGRGAVQEGVDLSNAEKQRLKDRPTEMELRRRNKDRRRALQSIGED